MRKREKTPSEHPELGLPEVRPLWEKSGLFSDHYLKVRIAGNDWWPSDEQARPVWVFCKELVERRAFGLRRYGNEEEVRQELIEPILERLGLGWSRNLGLPDQELEPDYIFYASASEKEAVQGKDRTARYKAGIALLEAKKYGHPLSQISRRQQRYPHLQIRDYLSEAQTLGWGVLTNGRDWRLYCRDARPSDFFELNMEVAVQSLQSFKFFFALFHRDAFIRDAQGKCRLDRIRESAISAQTELESDLRERVFTLIANLANGFAKRPENGITDADLPRLYDNCLIYLYRLLFILYAEGRRLLPVEPHSRKYFKELSLERLKPTLQGFAYESHTQARLYREIGELCHIINGANEKANKEFGVPRYNGGLFDPKKHPDLETWSVSDAVLADVLRDLMFNPPPRRDEPALPIQTVDYADLNVQQLGSIYEGLLENHFERTVEAASSPLPTRRDAASTLPSGRLILVTDKAERKATGAYYTPDYIVKYIVEHTVGPLLTEIEQRAEVKAAGEAGLQNNSFADAVLDLNVCDPAMGSGHFLVEATTYLADAIVYHPTTRFQAEFERGESQERDEIAYWRRRVVESCIYGVDLNPLAVELSKLSLWLTCIASDAPLSFLDHHLRCGNSLIGARMDQLGRLPEKKSRSDERQLRFTFGPDFKRGVAETIRRIHRIEAEVSRDVATVKAKEQNWESEILPRLAPYKKVADLWTNTFFDGPLSEEEYLAAAKEILVAVDESAGQVRETTARYHIKELDRPYFHWELEFPDVFFNEDGTPGKRPGFDAVIGNPPYVSFGLRGVGKVGEEEKEYYLMQFGSSAEYKISLYALFMEAALKLTRIGGYQGYIVPDSFLLGKYFSRVRECILEQAVICSLMLFHEDFWKSGTVGKPVVYVTHKNAGSEERGEHKVKALTIKSLQDAIDGFIQSDEIPQKFFADSRLRRFRLILGADTRALFERIESAAPPLEKFVKFYSGLIGLRGQDAVTLTKKPADYSPEKYGRLVASSGNLQRYSLSYEGLYCPKDSDVYKSGYKPEIYEKPKLFLNQTGDHLKCCFDLDGFYCLNNMHVGYPTNTQFDLRYSNTILCSRLMDFYYKAVSLEKGRANAQTDIDVIDALPIRRIAFTTPKAERERHMKKAQKTYERGLRDNDAGAALSAVDEHLNAARADVVHDLLAFLAERMMALNNEKHEAAQGFFTNLKEFYGVDARSMKPKTRLDEFWKLETTDVFAHFKANARPLAAQGVRLKEADEDKIRSRFQKAKDKIVPVETALTFTDRLIDRIVYRLYDLTQDEIAIVEGQS